MADKCEFCVQKCPQAERAHQTALGRMYAMSEFIALLKKVESGEFVEVVRCKDCKHFIQEEHGCNHFGYYSHTPWVDEVDFCSYGEKREGE